MTKLEIVRELCSSRGITINKLEQELGFSQGSIGKINSSKPNAERLYAIAKYFDVPMEVFFDEKCEKPVYEVAAGQGRINDGGYAEFSSYDDALEDQYWCKVVGDSMYPVLMDGDMILVQIQTSTQPTDLTVVKINGDEATCKYVEVVSDGVWLRAENKDVFEDTFYSVQEVLTLPISIVGKVIKMQRVL